MNGFDMNISTKKLARITGIFYLLIIFCGLYSGMMIRGSIIDYMDSDATLQNLIDQEGMYRVGFLFDLLMVISDVMVSLLFYYLLRPVHKGLATVAAAFRLMQSAILGVNLIHLFQPVLMIQGHEFLDAAQLSVLAQEVQGQLMVFDYGYLVSGVFFAVNCLLMGYLLYRSEIFPRIFGGMMALAGLGYLFNCMAAFVAPSLVELSAMLMFFTAVTAEISLCGYLLIKGVKGKAAKKLALV